MSRKKNIVIQMKVFTDLIITHEV